MPFDAGLPWISPGSAEGTLYTIKSSQSRQMASLDNVLRCGKAGGEVVLTSMQDLIYDSPELDDYVDVAERLSVWDDGEQVYVGVKADDRILSRAQEMETVYPVLQSSLDLSAQNGKALAAFENCLSEQAF